MGAAKHHPGLCRAICRGYIKQIQYEAYPLRQLLSVEANDVVEEVPEHEEGQCKYMWACEDAIDKAIDPTWVRKARMEILITLIQEMCG